MGEPYSFPAPGYRLIVSEEASHRERALTPSFSLEELGDQLLQSSNGEDWLHHVRNADA
jgi:hypothetical protein